MQFANYNATEGAIYLPATGVPGDGELFKSEFLGLEALQMELCRARRIDGEGKVL